MTIEIRRLLPADWSAWKAIRLEALSRDPDAYGSSFEAEVGRPDSAFEKALESSEITAIFANGEPVGCAGIFRLDGTKRRHRGTLFGVYLRAEMRGRGLADALVKAVLSEARMDYVQLHCTVVVGNETARRLYERHGFRVYAVEPRSLCIDGRFYDEYLMVCPLDQA